MKIMLFKGKLPGLKSIDLDFSEDCVYRKQRKVSFSKVMKSRRQKSWSWFILMCRVRPLSVPSLGGSLYSVTFIDDASKKVWIYFLKQKSKVIDVFKKWLAQVENKTGLKLKCLKSNMG